MSTLEGPSWPATVAALQADVTAQGRTVHAVVTDESGRRAACQEYTLSLDAVGAAAFAVGACDPTTRATPLVLRNRAALFSHDDVVAHPLPVTLVATLVRNASASGGAADAAGSSEVQCSVAVRPFLRDMEHGTVVYLAPGRFVLRLIGAAARGVTATADAQAWTLHGTAAAALTVDYEVVDTARGQIVLRDRATLACAVAPWRSPVAGATVAAAGPTTMVAPGGVVLVPGSPSCAEAEPLPLGVPVAGSTRGGVNRFGGSCGASDRSPEHLYALTVPQRARVALRLASNYDGVIYVRRACDDPSTELACNDDAGDTRHSSLDAVLDPGLYYVVVDGYAGSQGEFVLQATLGEGYVAPLQVPPSTVVGAPVAVASAEPDLGYSVSGSTAGAMSQTGGSCGSSSTAPETAYQFTLAQPAHVVLRLASNYDGVLYVREAFGLARERGCNDDAGDTRHSALDLDLEPGTYVVFVDGYSSASGTFTLRANVPLSVGPAALAASRPQARVEFAAGYAMSIPSRPWALAQGLVTEVRGNVPFGSFAFLFGARLRTEWSQCRPSMITSTSGGCGVAMPSSGSGTIGNVEGTLWSLGAPVGIQWRALGSALRFDATIAPGWTWLVTPSHVMDGFGATMSLGLEARIGFFATYIELGYRMSFLSGAPSGTNTPLLDGFTLVTGFRI